MQKPIQSNRKGEVAEGLPGSLKSVACEKRRSTLVLEHSATPESEPPVDSEFTVVVVTCIDSKQNIR